jgi:hypothetical protein
MSRSSRQRKAEARLAQYETEFVRKLTAALRDCAAGKWGLFGQNDHLLNVKSPAAELVALGENIREVRAELGFPELLTPYEHFLRYRAMREPNTPGEPKLAAALLAALKVQQGL